jgi:hypothetical protein
MHARSSQEHFVERTTNSRGSTGNQTKKKGHQVVKADQSIAASFMLDAYRFILLQNEPMLTHVDIYPHHRS